MNKLNNKENEVINNNVNDVSEAVDVALNYLAKNGIIVFTREVRSVFRNSMIWVVEIESDKFTGVIIIKSKTGEVAAKVVE